MEEVTGLHVGLVDLAGLVEETSYSAPKDVTPSMVAEFIIENEEPDEHGRYMDREWYRPAIEAIARVALEQIRIAREEVALEAAVPEVVDIFPEPEKRTVGARVSLGGSEHWFDFRVDASELSGRTFLVALDVGCSASVLEAVETAWEAL